MTQYHFVTKNFKFNVYSHNHTGFLSSVVITFSAKTLLFGIDLYVKTVKVNAGIYSLLL